MHEHTQTSTEAHHSHAHAETRDCPCKGDGTSATMHVCCRHLFLSLSSGHSQYAPEIGHWERASAPLAKDDTWACNFLDPLLQDWLKMNRESEGERERDTHTHTHIHTRTHIHMYIHMCMYTFIHMMNRKMRKIQDKTVCVYVCDFEIYAFTCNYMCIYICITSRTCINTYIHNCQSTPAWITCKVFSTSKLWPNLENTLLLVVARDTTRNVWCHTVPKGPIQIHNQLQNAPRALVTAGIHKHEYIYVYVCVCLCLFLSGRERDTYICTYVYVPVYIHVLYFSLSNTLSFFPLSLSLEKQPN
jgi:hypothetical protein